MKKIRVTTAIMAIAFISLTAMSCRENKKEDAHDSMHSEMREEGLHDNSMMNQNDSMMDRDKMDTSNNMMNTNMQNSDAKQVLVDYMVLKDALVATDENAAAKAGKKLESTLKGFNVSSNYTSEQQEELKDIIEVAMEHAEHIGKSDISHQREHFNMLSKDIIDMVAITGTKNTLYQQFCPMYDDGGTWLSLEKNIRNPYFGNKMMNCGEVQKEIN